MIDIHCHILPGLDDGAQNIEESLSLSNAAVDEGIAIIFATPHHQNGHYINEKEKVILETEKLQDILKEKKIPLTLVPSQEIRVYSNIIEDLKNDRLLLLGNKYLLLELPPNHIPTNFERIIYEILLLGKIPIIPHPERNASFRHNPKVLYKLIEQGALSQLTAASVIGKFGKDIQKFSLQCLKHNLSHFIASDAHNLVSRGIRLAEAYQLIQRKLGIETVEYLMKNTEYILEGRDIVSDIPIEIESKKSLLQYIKRGFFNG